MVVREITMTTMKTISIVKKMTRRPWVNLEEEGVGRRSGEERRGGGGCFDGDHPGEDY